MTNCKNKMSFSSELDMISKELPNSALIHYNVNLMTDVSRLLPNIV